VALVAALCAAEGEPHRLRPQRREGVRSTCGDPPTKVLHGRKKVVGVVKLWKPHSRREIWRCLSRGDTSSRGREKSE
jgi:hypothetical protein